MVEQGSLLTNLEVSMAKKIFAVSQNAMSVSNAFYSAVATVSKKTNVDVINNMHQSLKWFGLNFTGVQKIFEKINKLTGIQLFSTIDIIGWDRLSPWIALDMDEITLTIIWNEVELRYNRWLDGKGSAQA
jgi:hypothetical protein